MLGVEFSPEMIKRARDPELEVKSLGKALEEEAKTEIRGKVEKLRGVNRENKVIPELKTRMAQSEKEEIDAVEKDFEEHRSSAEARKNGILSTTERPVFITSDIQTNECRDKILEHFGGSKVHMICVI